MFSFSMCGVLKEHIKLFSKKKIKLHESKKNKKGKRKTMNRIVKAKV